MNRKEYLLALVAEEATEVTHRAHKALRFGTTEVQTGAHLDNIDLLEHEVMDLEVALGLLRQELSRLGEGDRMLYRDDYPREYKAAKRRKLERWMGWSAMCGTLSELPE